jgi:hypothetical protein
VLTLAQAQDEFRDIFKPTLLAIGALSKTISHKPRDWRAVRTAAGVVATRERILSTELQSIRWPGKAFATARTLAQAVAHHLIQFRQLAGAQSKTEVDRMLSRLRPNSDLRALIKVFRSQLGFSARPRATPRRS